ncbi:MAG: hypothetical protein LH465_00975 [Sphingomonas bacterium]|nr:hypothetical protein [Sphingomonas bacterium]
MQRVFKIMLIVGGAVFAVTAASAAFAQAADQATPKGWSYEIKDGKRVPKGERTVNADGSSREEIRKGNCVTIKERSANGELKTTSRCD